MHLPLLGAWIAAAKAGRREGRRAEPAVSALRRRQAAVLVLGALPPALHDALSARYILRNAGDADASGAHAIVANAEHGLDENTMARMRALRLIVVLGREADRVDLGAATSHRIRVVLAGCDDLTPQRVIRHVDASLLGLPLPSAVV